MTGSHHSNPVSIEATCIALMYRPWVFRITDPDSPLNVIANDAFGSTLIGAYRSTIPINDAHTVMEECGEQIAALEAVMKGIPCNKEFWVTSRLHGWVWYEVAHGSLARMDQPFNPQIRYNYDGSFTARSTNHPIRMMAEPDAKTGTESAPVPTPGNGSILP
jgi:hypothetical protein